MVEQENRVRVLKAHEDASVNFVSGAEVGAFEARYVRRGSDYFIAYVSSQTGCDRACRFCHLTATGQTSMANASVDEYVRQVNDVLGHHREQVVRPDTMNVNFMARGEPLLNPVLHDRSLWSEMRTRIREAAAKEGISTVRFNVSTIMPTQETIPDLSSVLIDGDATVYYSLYSLRPAFRRKWLPKAIDPYEALAILAAWQQTTGQEVAIHGAFIAGWNDDEETQHEIVAAVRQSGLRPKFNAVRYNPFDDRRGAEPDEEIVERNFAILSEGFGHSHSRIVPRVGFSVKASCGMFVTAGGMRCDSPKKTLEHA